MILQRLRAETSWNHSAIESQMPVLDPDLSLAIYCQLLNRFWGYYAPLEDLLRIEIDIYWPGKEYISSERAKAPLLEKDLRVFGQSAELLERCTSLPELKTHAQVLGCLYVIEGATLGGQIISKHLLANLGLGPETGAAFFNGYGADTCLQWQSFRSFLTSNAESMNQDDEIVVSGNDIFKTLSQWLFPNSNCDRTHATSVAVEVKECVLRVRDTGVGISPTLLPKIFDLFTQAERSLDRSQGGLGIGLALAQRLTELHGGRVEVHSSLGQGSEFVVRLPLIAVEFEKKVPISAKVDPKVVHPLRVLVVDDNLDTVLSFSILMRASGHEVFTANDGLTAVEVVSEHHPDVILLDIGLPGINGYEVAKRVRQQPGGNHVVLVALTGYGQDTDREMSA